MLLPTGADGLPMYPPAGGMPPYIPDGAAAGWFIFGYIGEGLGFAVGWIGGRYAVVAPAGVAGFETAEEVGFADGGGAMGTMGGLYPELPAGI